MIFCSVLVVQRDMVTWAAEGLICGLKEVDSAILACKDGVCAEKPTSKGPWGGPSAVTMRRFDFGTGNRPIEKECVALPLARGGNRLPRVATGEVHETLEVAPPRPRKPSKMRRWSMVEWCSGTRSRQQGTESQVGTVR